MRINHNIKNLILLLFIIAGMLIILERKSFTEKEIFTYIYDNDKWGKGSGPGSYEENTEVYRKLLQEYFNDSRFKTIIDYGCGDFQIMELINVPDNKIYKGVDVVKKVIENNKKLYGKDNIQFSQIEDFDQLKDNGLLIGDLLIVKDVFIHWPNNKIQNFLDTILPNFNYALITHDIAEECFNKDIQLGGFRPLDIGVSPFNFQNLTVIKEYGTQETGGKKRVYLYTNPRFYEH
ncbi:hypothetical protein [Rickettsia endosymbiont of Orchestes rusci]|uniref:hypothetical protein n=1 Tax=Rickettsia endosymbiont of Orchestes rusci TaxID=3066250 RepID=UPI00313C028E